MPLSYQNKMNHLNSSTKITIIIKHESSIDYSFFLNINDKLETVILEFSSKIGVDVKHLVFLYNGGNLKHDLKKSISQVMNNIDKKRKIMNIISYQQLPEEHNYISKTNNIIIILTIDDKKVKILKGKKGEPIINIIQRENSEIISELNKLVFKYRKKKVDLNKTFDNIADEGDKEDKVLIIEVNHEGLIKVSFIKDCLEPKIIYSIYCFPQEKVINACNKCCSVNNLNINKLNFYVNNNEINLEATINQLYITINNNFSSDTLNNFPINNTSIENDDNYEDKQKEIIIKVLEKKEKDNKNESSCIKMNKKLIIIISSILGILIICSIIITILVIRSKSKDKDNNSSFNSQIQSDTIKYTNDPYDPLDTIKKTESLDDTSTKTEEVKDMIKKTDETNNNPQNTNVICNKGYFIPSDDFTLKDCQKCSLEGCAKCSGTYSNNICNDCGELTSLYENGKIIKCNTNSKNMCDIGDEEKCLTCVENKNECKTCNVAYVLKDGKCSPDYFLKVEYLTKQKDDKIKIINDYSIVKYIITEGKKTTLDSINYQFKEEGNQTVYFQFKDSYYNNPGLFSNIRHIKSAVFSNFDEYHMHFSLSSMFSGCQNLTSVDFSKLAYIYSSNMEYIFNGCINLTYVNLKNLKASQDIAFMFNDCKSLTSIDLSQFDVSGGEFLSNMFKNCTSLQSVNLKGFKLDKASTIESIFYNCYSLKYLDLSSFKPSKLYNINSAFYNCSSLTSINFLDFFSDLEYMRSLFFNCSSLKLLDLTDFNTKRAIYMNNMFQGCNSLTSIIIGPSFIVNDVSYINSMFSGCYSLKSISFDIIVTNKVYSLDSFFSDCYSLTSVNLKNFDTSNVNNFSNMFHNCYNLKNIDISNFKFQRNANLKGMFSGCYSITSVDFSNINPDYYQFDGIFYDCPNLNYLNFSFLHYASYSTLSHYIFNNNISKNGYLILNEEYYNKVLKDINNYPPNGWTLNLTN